MGGYWLTAVLVRMAAQFTIGPYLDAVTRKRVMRYSEITRLVAYTLVFVGMLTHHLRILEYGICIRNLRTEGMRWTFAC